MTRFSRDLESSSLPGATEREKDNLTNEVFFYKCKFPLRGNFYSVFRVSPMSAVSQNNQIKISFMPKWYVLGWHFLVYKELGRT